MDIDKMGTIPGISQLHGKAQTLKLGQQSLTVIPLFHPAAMLYNPPLRETLNADFQKLKPHLT